MAYTPTEWVNDSEPAIDADNLNNIETGIAAAHDHIALTDNPHSVTAVQAGAAADDHDHAGVYEPADATILKDADIGSSVAAQGHDHSGVYEPADADIQTHITAAHAPSNADNTAANETSHADVVVDGDFDSDGFLIRSGGAGSYSVDTSTYSASDHDHAGTYEPADATILKQADVDDVPVNGVTTAPVSSNWAYDHADSHAPSNADNTAANETSHADVVVDADIGVNVAAYDHNHDADYADIANEHAESHTVASHSDTSATGAELDELTDGSTTSLHSHAGGASVYELVKCKGNLSSASFDDTENALSWNSPVIGSGSSNVSISGSEITIDTSGTYKFTVTLRTDSANRTELFIRTYINTGAGLTQDTDEIVSDYVSRDADQDTGAVTLITALELDATDVVEFRGFGDTDGACVGLDAGTILLVERVA
jgi:hypothetical protein